MGAKWKHFLTICRHKWVVYQECKACGIPWRGIVHDLSKFGPVEFSASARHFQGNRSPIEAEKEEIGYSAAWLHHKGHNPHHWEYWTDFGKNGEVIPAKIPFNVVVEMVCDWIGAGKVYNQEHWSQRDPLDYYNKVRAGRHFHPDTEKLILLFLTTISEEGLEEFHWMAKCETNSEYENLKTEYEKGEL